MVISLPLCEMAHFKETIEVIYSHLSEGVLSHRVNLSNQTPTQTLEGSDKVLWAAKADVPRSTP